MTSSQNVHTLRLSIDVELIQKKAIGHAQAEKHEKLTPMHFFYAFLQNEDEDDPYLYPIIFEQKTSTSHDHISTIEDWKTLVEKHFNTVGKVEYVDEKTLKNQAEEITQSASKFQTNKNADVLLRDHLLLYLLEDLTILDLLKRAGFTKESIEKTVALADVNIRDSTAEDTEHIKAYTRDLRQMAKKGELGSAIIGRTNEIGQCLEILMRRTKANPILVGEPGVGKTAVAEGLAILLSKTDPIGDNDSNDKNYQNPYGIPPVLSGARVLALDIAALRSGAKFRGELEERIKGILDELVLFKEPVVLFIDEIHMLMGDGRSDEANMLKPFLARGDKGLRCIGATTNDEYRKHILPDPAFVRRFEKVNVAEPSEETTLDILRSLKKKVGKHYDVRILDEALKTCVTLAKQYFASKKMPDSAIDLLENSAAAAASQKIGMIDELVQMEEQIMKLTLEVKSLEEDKSTVKVRSLENDKLVTKVYESSDTIKKKLDETIKSFNELKKSNDISEATLTKLFKSLEDNKKILENERTNSLKYLDTKIFILPKIEKMIASLQQKQKQNDLIPAGLVNSILVRKVAAKLSGIPDTSLSHDDKLQLEDMQRYLKEKIIGQTHAIDQLCQKIRLKRMGLLQRDDNPLSFLFAGISGSGKTELAKQLAVKLFGSSSALIRIDCSELQDKGSVTKLVGAPPGYVGFAEAGILTESLRTRPYSIVLFDEVEKADSTVLTVLLQVLGDGRVRDNYGKEINCSNAIFIMTSNTGAVETANNRLVDQELENLLAEKMSPELVNRISSIILFNQLSKADMEKILDLRKKEFIEQLHKKDYKIELNITQKAKEYLLTQQSSPLFGARPLTRLMEKEIYEQIGQFILADQIKRNDDCYQTVHVDMNLLGDGLNVFIGQPLIVIT